MPETNNNEQVTKKIYLMRHGETDLNKNGIVQGRGVDSDLNETGIYQGRAFFQKYKDVKFDKVYTSTLKRTHQTIKDFIDLGLPWQQLAGFDELDWGKYEGMDSTPDLRDAFKNLVQCWNLGHYDVKPQGGESPDEVYIRQAKAMQEVLSHPTEKTILICMHGRAIRLLLCQLLKQPLNKMDDYPHQNTSLYILNYDGQDFEIEVFNSLDHIR